MDGLAKMFGRQLRAMRKARGMTQERLGRAAKLDYKHIGSIERGEKTPSFDAIEGIATALGVEYYEFFLPDRLAADFFERGLNHLTHSLGEIDRSRLERFCRDAATAMQRLNKS